ncbi:MAG: diacylglycerol kinase [Candidatus Moranbacteria bacterium]|nr:diacylglycerol kinase [Candidatus Moranbacteria bacterium]
MNRLRQFSESFFYALRGLRYIISHEKNFQNEVFIGLLVIIAMIYFQVTRAESVVLFLVIMTVLVLEILNTVMERVVDILKPRVHPYARLIKDLMAAGVLITSIVAIIIGLLIFIPYFQKWIAG